MSIDLHTLSGAYALDALSAEEAAEFEKHLQDCSACRDEVRELQDAASLMGASQATSPSAALRARVLTAADHQPQLRPRVTALASARTRRRGWVPVLAAAAVAAIIAFAGFGVLQDRDGSTDRSPATTSVAQVFKASDARTASIPVSTWGRIRVATSAQNGQMAVDTHGLRQLDGRAYQLWAVRNGHSTSVGVIDDVTTGTVVPIPVAGTTVAITVEPEGGSTQPTTQPIVTMDPETV